MANLIEFPFFFYLLPIVRIGRFIMGIKICHIFFALLLIIAENYHWQTLILQYALRLRPTFTKLLQKEVGLNYFITP